MLLCAFGPVRIFCGQLNMLLIAKAKKVESVTREHGEFLRQHIQLIEIHVKYKDIVMKPVNFGFKTVVHNKGFVEAGVQMAVADGQLVNYRFVN